MPYFKVSYVAECSHWHDALVCNLKEVAFALTVGCSILGYTDLDITDDLSAWKPLVVECRWLRCY